MNLISENCLDSSVISVKHAPLLAHLLTCNLLIATGYSAGATAMNKYHKSIVIFRMLERFYDQVF
jgi:hypothetical protein